MRYAMLLKAHSNVRYEQSLQKLALRELECSLDALGLNTSPFVRTVAGESFLCFDSDELSADELRVISAHSGICLLGALEGDSLRLIQRQRYAYLPRELPQVLKYKGKTNADFTELLINCALSASDFTGSREPLNVLDPLCGKGTTLFCALSRGFNAVGVERDDKALREADGYLERFLTMNRLKHKRQTGSQTLAGGGSAKLVRFELSDTSEHWRQGDTRTLTMLNADAARLSELVKRASAHLIVADMPYGVQHAPGEGGTMSTMTRLAVALASGCRRALMEGGAVALSFNTYTLKREDIERAFTEAGLKVLSEPPYRDFSHWVEQAVNRDALFARK